MNENHIDSNDSFDSDENENSKQVIPIDTISAIPDLYYNSRTENAHKYCYNCKKYLLKPGTLYMIEKAFKQDQVLFDYAICLDCGELYADEYFSNESLGNLNQLFNRHIDFDKRSQVFPEKYGNDHSQWLQYCLLTGKPIAEAEEYQICGQFDGSNLLYYQMPFALSDEGIEMIMSCLSQKTKDDLQDFMDDLNWSPRIAKSIGSRDPVLLF